MTRLMSSDEIRRIIGNITQQAISVRWNRINDGDVAKFKGSDRRFIKRGTKHHPQWEMLDDAQTEATPAKQEPETAPEPEASVPAPIAITAPVPRSDFDRSRLPSPSGFWTTHGVPVGDLPGWVSGKCIFHDDTRASLSVNAETGGFVCHACGAKGGDVLDAHRLLTGEDFRTAAKQLGAIDDTGTTEKSSGTIFFADYAGYAGYKPLQPSDGKGYSDTAPVTNAVASNQNSDYSATEAVKNALVSPIPGDAPAVPDKLMIANIDGHRVKLSAKWTYVDAAQHALCHILRFDANGKKQFRPLTLWHTGKGREWKAKGLPEPRPLYGLDRLAAKPEATVIACEGEKSADAATALFPEHVSVTSMNGSQSPAKTDWLPLAGRTVAFWPDNDQPGRDYVTAVEKLAADADATVSGMLNTSFFLMAGQELGIERDELPKGWDAADALTEGFTAENIRIFSQEHPEIPVFLESAGYKPLQPGNGKGLACSEFSVAEFQKGRKNGVYWQAPCEEDEEPKPPMWLILLCQIPLQADAERIAACFR